MASNSSYFLKQLNFIECTVSCDEPMRLHTSFKTGGNAEFFVTVKNADCLVKVLKLADEAGMRKTIIGNGTNILVRDEGIDGVVISMADSFSSLKQEGNVLVCDAGVPLVKVCKLALENSMTGLEFAYGIPGTVGGAVTMNAGAYGGEIRDCLLSVTHMTPDFKVETVDARELELSYRHSFYTDHPDYIVLSAKILLKDGDVREIKSRMDELLAKRREKQPLEYPSAGSTFKRPENNFAGSLIEMCSLKGSSVGGAMVSEKHAGFIINYDNATSSDILQLIENVQKTVLDRTGVSLETEVKIIP